MGWFKKKHDPISDKARALNQQIEALEAEIKKLSDQAASPQPRFRSSALPGAHAVSSRPPRKEHFEEIDHTPLKAPMETAPREHFNELGVRKYDLVAAWHR